MKFDKTFITGTLMEAADYAATTLSQRFALKQMAEKGVCTLEEAQNLYELSYRMLTEGSEDLIPENLELPDATDEVDPTTAQDTAVDADVAAAGGEVADEDFAIEDLEGIILPDSEGNQYLIQGGILVPYNEDDDSSITTDGEEPADDKPIAPDDQIAENTTVVASAAPVMENTIEGGDAAPIEKNTDVAPIEENTFAAHSSIIANLIQNAQFK